MQSEIKKVSAGVLLSIVALTITLLIPTGHALASAPLTTTQSTLTATSIKLPTKNQLPSQSGNYNNSLNSTNNLKGKNASNNKSVCSATSTCSINTSKKETYPLKVKNEVMNKGNKTELKVKEKTEEMRNSNKTEVMQKIEKMINEQKMLMENRSKGNETMTKNKEMIRVEVMKRTATILEMLANVTENREVNEKLMTVAKQCNETAMNIQKAEERIEKRSKIMRILFGGDLKAAKELMQEKERIQEQIQMLESVLNQTQNSYEREIIQEQIRTLQKEMEQIQEVAQQQEQEKGILGWIFRL